MQLDLRDYLNVLLKRWWVILLVALGAAVAGYAYSLTQPRLYQAEVKIEARANQFDNGLEQYLRSNIGSYTTGLTSRDFISSVLTDAANAGKLDDLTPDDVLGRLKVQALPDQNLLDMTVDDTDPRRAADLANAIADAFATQQNAIAQQSTSAQKIFLQQIDTARPPTAPHQPRPLLNTAAAAVLGLVLGLILVFALEFADTSLKTPDDVQRYLALTTVGAIPAHK